VAQKFGRRGSVLLQCAIAVHVSGVMVGYNGERARVAGRAALLRLLRVL
jgi:hypothetical protein